MLNFSEPVHSHELGKSIRKVDDFTPGFNKLAKCREQLILVIGSLNCTAAPIDCGMLLQLMLPDLLP